MSRITGTSGRVRVQCSEMSETEKRDYRFADMRGRWPDVPYTARRGYEVVDRCEAWGAAADSLGWDFPVEGPVPGNDYPNNLYFIKKASGLPADAVLSYTADSTGMTASA